MSGIAGLVFSEAASGEEARATVGRMCDLLAHRGPDRRRVLEGRGFCFGETVWTYPRKNGGGIFEGRDGALSIVFDGFLTNRSAAREALEREGARLPSGDTRGTCSSEDAKTPTRS